MKQPVGLDFFCEFQFPRALRTSATGHLCFATKRASLTKNRYETAFWLYKDGRLHRLRLPKGTAAAFWQDDDTLLLFGAGTAADKRRAKQGLPCGKALLYSLKDSKAAPLATWHLELEDALPLAGGRWLLLARWDPTVQQALQTAGGDADEAAKLLQQQAACSEVTQLPFWENGGGFIGKARRRLYVWDSGKDLQPLTDEHTEVEGLWPAQNGSGTWFSSKRYTTLAPVEEHLWHWDAADGSLREYTVAQPFRTHWVAALPTGDALVAGTDMQACGVNQNPAFYRLCAATGKAACLYDGGRYSEDGWVAMDLSMAGGCRPVVFGQSVYWISSLDEGSQLMAIDTENGDIRQVTHTAGAVQELAAVPGGGVYTVALRAQNGPEVFFIDTTGEETPVTQFNVGIPSQYALAAPRPVTACTADGTDIHGFVLLPEAAAKTNSIPAILDVHGGPKTVYSAAVFHEMQLWAAQGFAVLFCNPRGSCGRGDAFADIRGQYGGVDTSDILCFLDEALRQYPQIDATRVGVTGGSYGGFMTNWLIGHTKRFAAAASQRGIASWQTMALISDIGYFFSPDQTGGGDPWQNPEALLRQSPLLAANTVATPTLFIHSDADYRCPLPEGIQMAAALMLQGTPAKLCIFHGENHELSRSGKPQNRVKRLREITAWFCRYLQNEPANGD